MDNIEERPWGKFFIIYEDEKCKIKKIIVNPKAKLSLQSHEKRDENWKLISGKWKVTYGIIEITDIDSVFIKRGIKHRVENIGTEPLEFIEIQTGNYFGEDDIIRFSDDFGRV